MSVKTMSVKEALDKLGAARRKYEEMLAQTPVVGGFSIGEGSPSGYKSDLECLTEQQKYVDKLSGLATYICVLDSAIKLSNAKTELICNGLRSGATVAEGIIRMELYFPMDKKVKKRHNNAKTLLNAVTKERTSSFRKKEDALQKVQTDAQAYGLKSAETVQGATEKQTLIDKNKKKYIDENPVRWLEHDVIQPFVEKLVWISDNFETELSTAIQNSNMTTKLSVELTGKYDDIVTDAPGIL